MSTFNYVGRSYTYTGRIYKNCSPSGAQQSALAQETSWANTVQSNMKTVFGAGSSIFKSLKAGYDKIISSVHGMTPEELAARRTEVSTNAVAANQKAQAAIGRRGAMTSAVPGIESGVTQAVRAKATTDVLNQESAAQENITAEDYSTGRKERDLAMEGEASLPGKAFDPAASFTGAENTALGEESQQANANEAASSSWMGLVGGLASSAIGAAGNAACVSLDTNVRSADGKDELAGSLELGDKLFGFSGPETIVGLFVSTQPCVRITMDNGSVIVVSKSHTFLSPLGGYVMAEDCQGRFLRTAEVWDKVASVEDAGWQAVVMIKLNNLHGYISNGIWSLE